MSCSGVNNKTNRIRMNFHERGNKIYVCNVEHEFSQSRDVDVIFSNKIDSKKGDFS